MISCREFFRDMEERDLKVHFELGNKKVYNTIEISTINFQRESRSHLRLKDVMFVLGLKKDLIFLAVLEDHGYVVILSKGKAFLRHSDWIGEVN